MVRSSFFSPFNYTTPDAIPKKVIGQKVQYYQVMGCASLIDDSKNCTIRKMRIGIDISQLAYEGTGVANYLGNLVAKLVEIDRENEYILFYSSLRRNFQFSILNFQSNSNVTIKQFKFPPALLDILWNRLHIVPIEWFIGDVDVFITSDWTEPPTVRARKATILYDLIVYRFPKETDQKIVSVQRRKLAWVKKESNMIFCISEATKKDAMDILGIEGKRLQVIYPGVPT